MVIKNKNKKNPCTFRPKHAEPLHIHIYTYGTPTYTQATLAVIGLVTVPVKNNTEGHLACLTHEWSAFPTQPAFSAPLCGFF